MRISDWSSDVCSSDLGCAKTPRRSGLRQGHREAQLPSTKRMTGAIRGHARAASIARNRQGPGVHSDQPRGGTRSEEHTSELQSLMRSSYDVFCLTNKTPVVKKYKDHTTRSQLQHPKI